MQIMCFISLSPLALTRSLLETTPTTDFENVWPGSLCWSHTGRSFPLVRYVGRTLDVHSRWFAMSAAHSAPSPAATTIAV